MIHNLYIATVEPYSGKSVIVLGMMELLKRHTENIGFFRPIIPSGDGINNEIDLLRTRYNLKMPYEDMYGFTHDEARNLIGKGKMDDLVKEILTKYKRMESQCDFVLCLGTDMTGVATSFEIDFNAEIANNLGCPVMPVISGVAKTVDQIIDVANICNETFSGKGCDILATIVNRVAADQIDRVNEGIKAGVDSNQVIHVLPEISHLGKPTLGELAKELNAECVIRDPAGLNRIVDGIQVAAMEMVNLLDRLREHSLIITPGDRSDVILGCLLSVRSGTYPTIAGMLLCGGVKPPPGVQKLIDGLRHQVPMLYVDTNTFNTTLNASRVRSAITPEDGRKIAYALETFDSHVDLSALENRIAVAQATRVTPIMFEHGLFQRAKGDRKHIVLPEGEEDRILYATEQLLLRGVVDVTLLGDEQVIRQKIGTLGINVEGANIVNPATSKLRKEYADAYYEIRKHKGVTEDHVYEMMLDVSYFGTMMVHCGHLDGMVSGSVHTTQHTIRPAFEVIRTRPGCSVVSSVFLMCMEDRVLVYGDCAVNPNPDATMLADIAVSSADTAAGFGIDPYVAMLSYSTGKSGAGKDVEMVREATAIARKARPDLKIEGPIQYDAAVDASVAKTKLPESQVAGHATVFIFPDLNTGNNTYKAVQRSAGAVAIGPVLQGLNKPVNDLSRGCTVTDIVNTVCITAIQAQQAAAAAREEK